MRTMPVPATLARIPTAAGALTVEAWTDRLLITAESDASPLPVIVTLDAHHARIIAALLSAAAELLDNLLDKAPATG